MRVCVRVCVWVHAYVCTLVINFNKQQRYIVVKLLVERQRLIIYVKFGLFNYCFIKLIDNMLVFVMVFASRFRRYSVRNVVAGYRWILCRGYVFVSL